MRVEMRDREAPCGSREKVQRKWLIMYIGSIQLSINLIFLPHEAYYFISLWPPFVYFLLLKLYFQQSPVDFSLFLTKIQINCFLFFLISLEWLETKFLLAGKHIPVVVTFTLSQSMQLKEHIQVCQLHRLSLASILSVSYWIHVAAERRIYRRQKSQQNPLLLKMTAIPFS